MNYIYQAKTIPRELTDDPELQSLPPVLLEILHSRNFKTPEEIKNFLYDDFQVVLDNISMTDSDKAVDLLKNALEAGDKIAIYRDYDCDGCCAAAVAVEALVKLGGKVTHYGNERTVDGYGICKNGIDQIIRYHPDIRVILTVDNGIVAYEAIEYAKSLGLTVIVTDHHEMGEELPVADAIVDPKRRDEKAKFRDLCGAGVIFKLMVELFQSLNRDLAPILRTLDLVALATVADIMPLVGENRIIVREGLKMINQKQRPFFYEVAKQQKLKTVTAHNELGFQIGPLINAPSRMGADVSVAVSAMLTCMGPELEQYVAYLKNVNDKRRKETESAHNSAKNQLKKQNIDPETASTILLLCPDVADGLVGLVAGRLMNRHHKIVGVFHLGEQGFLKGSMRGVEGFHLKEALDQISEGVLLQYGGHAKAAGLSLKEENFPQFREEFTAIVEKAFPAGTGEIEVVVDAQLQESDCTLALASCLSALEPFGEGFRPPLLALEMSPKEVRFMGNEKQHVAYVGESGLRAIRWRYGEQERENPTISGVFYGTVEENNWNGRSSPQFKCI